MVGRRHYSYAEAVARLAEMGIDVTERTIRRLVSGGHIPKVKIGRKPMVREDDLLAYLDAERCRHIAHQEPARGTKHTSSGDISTDASVKSRRTQQTRETLARLGIGSKRSKGNVRSLDLARQERSHG